MEVIIIEEKKNRIVLEIKDSGHVFCNALTKELWNDEHVKVSAYRAEHPLKNIMQVVVETDGKKEPKRALVDAASRLSKDFEKFKGAFVKEVK